MKKNHQARGFFLERSSYRLGDRMEIMPAQDQSGTAGDRIVAVVLFDRRHLAP